ncbi:hypothetical protein P7K49_007230, partial [Saguinus oedipus]
DWIINPYPPRPPISSPCPRERLAASAEARRVPWAGRRSPELRGAGAERGPHAGGLRHRFERTRPRNVFRGVETDSARQGRPWRAVRFLASRSGLAGSAPRQGTDPWVQRAAAPPRPGLRSSTCRLAPPASTVASTCRAVFAAFGGSSKRRRRKNGVHTRQKTFRPGLFQRRRK